MSMPGCIDMEEMMSLSSKACTGININAVLIGLYSANIVLIVSNLLIIQSSVKKSEAFQSVHHVSFILCYIVLYNFLSLIFSLIRVRKLVWEDIT